MEQTSCTGTRQVPCKYLTHNRRAYECANCLGTCRTGCKISIYYIRTVSISTLLMFATSNAIFSSMVCDTRTQSIYISFPSMYKDGWTALLMASDNGHRNLVLFKAPVGGAGQVFSSTIRQSRPNMSKC